MSVAAVWISLRHCYVELRFCSSVAFSLRFFVAVCRKTSILRALRASCAEDSIACPFEGQKIALAVPSIPLVHFNEIANCALHVWMDTAGPIIASEQDSFVLMCTARWPCLLLTNLAMTEYPSVLLCFWCYGSVFLERKNTEDSDYIYICNHCFSVCRCFLQKPTWEQQLTLNKQWIYFVLDWQKSFSNIIWNKIHKWLKEKGKKRKKLYSIHAVVYFAFMFAKALLRD